MDMGIFILTTGNAETGRAETALARGGFRATWRHDFDGKRLLLFAKLDGSGGQAVTRPDGDFACVVGTLILGGRSGRAAVERLLDGFDPAAPPWPDSLGSWGAVVRKGGAVYLFADRLNGAKIFHAGGTFSNSFVALSEMGLGGGLDDHACFDYVWNGTVHGTRSLFSGIHTLDNGVVAHPDGSVRRFIPPPTAEPLPRGPIEAVADACLERLRRVFATYAVLWPGHVRSALSGGFDSRLLLALLLDAGMAPRLFVYGGPKDVDVKVAKAICAAEGLGLEHIDKDAAPPPEPDHFPAELEADLFAFDGWKNAGLFDDGSDRRDRLARAADDQVLMNGSVGECFRNFYYLRDGSFSVHDLVGVFHSTYDPAACTSAFRPAEYDARLAADLAAAVGADVRRPYPRAMVEKCYPLGRGRYWTARDAALNQRFGTSLTPFLEPAVFDGTWDIPLAFKNFGRLEALMIARAWPRLAGHGSAYGFAFDREPPLAYRLAMTANHWRPVALRRLSYRLKYRRPQPRPAVLTADYLRRVMDPSFPVTRRLFMPERVHATEAFNRLCTVEYLAQRYL
jgi:asparagine synthase (glutamine-hydrolysing)